VGSFLNVVIYRLPIMLNNEWTSECRTFLKLAAEKTPVKSFNLFLPRSHCPSCQQTIPLLRNIPLFSYLLQKGRCAYCQQKISFVYPLIEVLTALLTLWCFIYWQASLAFVFSCLLIWGLICLTFIDLKTQYLPDNLTYPLLWMGLFASIFHTFCSPTEAIIGAIAGYMSLWLVVKIFYLLTKKVGMGQGDFKLFALIGAWTGWQTLALTLVISSFLGAIIGVLYLKFKGESHDTPIPFGPYLCLGGFVSFFWGSEILNWYLSTAMIDPS
jgi:leader peptidase (prepilin peptidase)/N-methyltransferase